VSLLIASTTNIRIRQNDRIYQSLTGIHMVVMIDRIEKTGDTKNGNVKLFLVASMAPKGADIVRAKPRTMPM